MKKSRRIGRMAFKCTLCGKSFSKQSQLTNHTRVHSEEGPYKGNQCDKSFHQSSNLCLHKKSHSNKKMFKCKQYDKDFNWKGNLKQHMQIHNMVEKTYSCVHCDKWFFWEASWQKHQMTHSDKKHFKCTLCDRGFNEKTCLESHLVNHSFGNKPYKCNHCDRVYNSTSNLKNHTKTHGRKNLENLYKCSWCDKCSYWQYTLRRRERQVHDGQYSYKCAECGKGYPRESYLQSHMSKAHGSGKEPYKCPHWDKCFYWPSGLHRHQLTHKNAEKPYKCAQCQKAFTGNQFWMHTFWFILMRGPAKALNVTRLFKSSANLYHHKLVHRDGKSFKCPQCNKRFKLLMYVKRHQRRTHVANSAKPYKCIQCDSGFVIQSKLKKHVLAVHNLNQIAKRHKCTECNKCFNKLGLLREHLREHARDNNKCTPRHNYSTRSSVLSNQNRSLHGSLPHKCTPCGKCFKTDGALRRHTSVCRKISPEDREKFTCWMCGEFCENCCGILHHMFDHGMRKK